jgi:hypothetical protein
MSSLLHQNILLSTLFSNTVSPCSSFNVKDQVPHQYKTTGNIMVFYSLIFMPLDEKREDKISEPNGSKRYPNLIHLYFLHESNFDLSASFFNILCLGIFSNDVQEINLLYFSLTSYLTQKKQSYELGITYFCLHYRELIILELKYLGIVTFSIST